MKPLDEFRRIWKHQDIWLGREKALLSVLIVFADNWTLRIEGVSQAVLCRKAKISKSSLLRALDVLAGPAGVVGREKEKAPDGTNEINAYRLNLSALAQWTGHPRPAGWDGRPDAGGGSVTVAPPGAYGSRCDMAADDCPDGAPWCHGEAPRPYAVEPPQEGAQDSPQAAGRPRVRPKVAPPRKGPSSAPTAEELAELERAAIAAAEELAAEELARLDAAEELERAILAELRRWPELRPIANARSARALVRKAERCGRPLDLVSKALARMAVKVGRGESKALLPVALTYVRMQWPVHDAPLAPDACRDLFARLGRGVPGEPSPPVEELDASPPAPGELDAIRAELAALAELRRASEPDPLVREEQRITAERSARKTRRVRAAQALREFR